MLSRGSYKKYGLIGFGVALVSLGWLYLNAELERDRREERMKFWERNSAAIEAVHAADRCNDPRTLNRRFTPGKYFVPKGRIEYVYDVCNRNPDSRLGCMFGLVQLAENADSVLFVSEKKWLYGHYSNGGNAYAHNIRMCFASMMSEDVMRVVVTGYPPSAIVDRSDFKSGPGGGSGRALAIKAAKAWIRWMQSGGSGEFEFDKRVAVKDYEPAAKMTNSPNGNY